MRKYLNFIFAKHLLCKTRFKFRSAFTLIELLVVLAIVAILAVAVVLAVNPAELLKRTRDARRLDELSTLNTGISIYNIDVGGSLGNASTTYISIPDPAATSTSGTNCQSLGLPALPAGYQYHCGSRDNYKNIDGTGWVPLDFTRISSRSPFGSLPTDPVNTTSSGQYYIFAASSTGVWEISVNTESDKYSANAWDDGGDDMLRAEIGPNLFAALKPGLVVWLDASRITGLSDGSGISQWNDSSGSGNNGIQSSSTRQAIYKVGIINGKSVVRFDGVDDRFDMVSIPHGAGITVASRSATNQSLYEGTSLNPRGFTNKAAAATFDIFDRVYVNGVLTTAVGQWTSSLAVVSGMLNTNPLNTQAFEIGQGSPGFAYLQGDIAELFIWSYKISDADRKKAERYLGKKYGITIP